MNRFYPGLYCLLALVGAACSTKQSNNADVVRIRWERSPASFDPLEVPDEQALETLNLVHASLLSMDYASRQWVPYLVESLPQMRKQAAVTLATYQLRPQARWDTGQPVTARDVAFTLRLMQCPGLPNEQARADYGFIEDIRLDSADARKFTLVLRGRAPEYKWSSGDFPILPEYALDTRGELRVVSLASLRADTGAVHQPAVAALIRRYKAAQLGATPKHLPGCGPYTVSSMATNRYVIFQRKPHWWADTLHSTSSPLRALPRQLDYQIIPDAAGALLALRSGAIDVYPMPPAAEFARLQAQPAAGLQLSTADSYSMLTTCFNVRQPVLRDKYTRQGLSLLFQVPGLIKATQHGMGYPSAGIVNPTAGKFYNDSLAPLPYAPERAVALLNKAGWRRSPTGGWSQRRPSGQLLPLALSISYRTGEPAYEAIALQFRQAAAQIGIPITLRPTETSLFQQNLRSDQIDAYLYRLTGNPHIYNFAPSCTRAALTWATSPGSVRRPVTG